MEKLSTIDWIAFVLLIVGGLNWGLVGLFKFDLVLTIFKTVPVLKDIIYILVGLSALYFIYYLTKK